MKRAKAFTFLLGSLLLGSGLAQQKGWWSSYDYSQVSSQVVTRGDDAPILRGRAVKLDLDGQKISAFYDTGDMNLRYVTLGSIEFQGTPWDGKHGGNSLVGGELLFSNSPSLAWAYKGSWKDPRDFDYGPVPDQYVEFKGSYRSHDKTVLHYTVGDKASEVLEHPWTAKNGQDLVFIRQFQIAEAKEELILKVLDNDKVKIGQDLFLNCSQFKIDNNGKGLSFVRIPAGSKKLNFTVAYSKKKNFAKRKLASLDACLKGGDIRWPKTMTLSGKLKTDENETFVTDQIPLPTKNPYGSKIRFGGFDFFKDGKRAAFCTWNGDVWIASGLDKDLKNIVWKRYAAGLNEALGIRIINEKIYVTGKDQITRLHDLNNDGEADYYECFNNDIKITQNFHEFTFGLQTDKHGNFYFAKAAPVRQGGRGFDVTHDNHGVIFKVSADGEKSEIFYSGLRAPGGLSINEEGTIATTGENEGTYVPACKINYGKKGDFMGVIHPGNGRKEEQGYTKPLCFLPMTVDNSGGGQLWIPEGSWGDLGGTLMHLSYGQSKAYTVLKEEVNGQVQGGVIHLPFKLMSSAMRGRFNPANPQELYITGFKGWQTNASLESAINRITYKGKTFERASNIKATEKGIYLTFNAELDEQSANDLSNYAIERWNYFYTNQYGSGHFATGLPKEDLEPFTKTESKKVGRIGIPRNRAGELVFVTAAKLMDDKKTVFLKVNNMRPVDQMKIDYSLKTAKGNEVKQLIYNSIFNLSPDANSVADAVSLAELEAREKLNSYELGSQASFKDSTGKIDTIKSRMLNLQIKEGESVTPFLKEGDFEATYSGYLQVLEKDKLTFTVRGNGEFKLVISDKEIVAYNGQGQDVKTKALEMNAGFHKYTLTYKSPASGQPYFDVLWDGSKFPLGPISPNSLRYMPGGSLQAGESLRNIRKVIADKRCFSCHSTTDQLAMPELNMDSPSLANAGGRFNQKWLVDWITDPRKFNPRTHMPKLANKQEAAHIAAYLVKDVKKDFSGQLKGDVKNGAGLFYDLGCISCHTRPDKQNFKDTRKSLNYVADKFKPEALKEFLKKPEQNYKWTKMPNFKLSDKEAEDLASFLISMTSKPSVTGFPSGNAKLGEKLYKEKSCMNCHGGAEPVKLPMKNFSKGCMKKHSKIFMGLNFKFKRDMTAFLNRHRDSLTRKSSREFAERQVKELNCTACHVRDETASKWESHLTEIKDLKMVHKDKGHLDQSRPQLTFVGEKLTQETVKDYLRGTLPYETRDWLLARMPAFPARAEMMAEGLALQHARHGVKDETKTDNEAVKIGQKLVGANGGFACVICHDAGPQKAMAAFEVKGIDLMRSGERLTKDYYHRWMLNPAHLVPTTKMPKYADDQGKSPMADYGNDAAKQFEAIRQYLKTLQK